MARALGCDERSLARLRSWLWWAQPARLPPRPCPRLAGPIVLDGSPDEPAWRAIEPYPVIVYEPAWGSPPQQRTMIRVAHGDDYLYVGAELGDDQPDDVRRFPVSRSL